MLRYMHQQTVAGETHMNHQSIENTFVLALMHGIIVS